MDKIEPDPKRLKTTHTEEEKKEESIEQYVDEFVLADFDNDEFLSEPQASSLPSNELQKENDPFGDDEDDEIFLLINSQEILQKLELERITWRVFRNSLIWRKIMENLNFQDQKNIRLVCKDFNEYLLSETHFLNRAVIHITPTRAQEQHFGATTELYNHFVIDSWVLRRENFPDTRSRTGNSNWFYEKLINAETITLKVTQPDTSIFHDVIQKIIAAPTNLKQLAIHGSLLQFPTHTRYKWKNNVTYTIRNVTVSEEFKSTMKNLLEFQILGFRSVNMRNEDVLDVMEKLSALLKSLEVIKIDDVMFWGNSLAAPDKMTRFLQMIEDNREKLTTLKLDTPFLWKKFSGTIAGHSSVIEKSFPALHTIQIRMEHVDEPANIITFLKALPLLEDLDFTIFSRFDNTIFQAISQRSERLKRIRLKTHGFQQLDDKMWEFLSKLEHLEDFELNFPHSTSNLPHNCSLVTILNNLSHSIKKLSIVGLPSSTTSLTAGNFTKIDPSRIMELNLANCSNAVNDITMRFICQNFKLLRKLDVSGNNMITDFGFTGMDTYGASSFSLTALKGLIELKIRRCGSITNQTLIHAIRFLELKYLDVCENYRLDSTGFTSVLTNNPSLELIKTHRKTIAYNLEPTENYHEGKRTWINSQISSACPRFKGFAFGSSEQYEGDVRHVFQPNFGMHPLHHIFHNPYDDDDDDDDYQDYYGGYAYDDAFRADLESNSENEDGSDEDEDVHRNARQHVPHEPNYDSGPDSPEDDPDWDPNNDDLDQNNDVVDENNEESDDDSDSEDSDSEEEVPHRNNTARRHVPYEPNYDSGPDTPEEDPDWNPNNDVISQDSDIDDENSEYDDEEEDASDEDE